MDEQATAKSVGMDTYTMAAKVFTKLRHNLRIGGMLDVNMRNNKSFFVPIHVRIPTNGRSTRPGLIMPMTRMVISIICIIMI